MKIIRSAQSSLKFTTNTKLHVLEIVLSEYGNVVNFFINHFWESKLPEKKELLKSIVDLPQTWLGFALRQIAAREAIDLISSVKNKKKGKKGKPIHSGKSMRVTSIIGTLQTKKFTTEFDCWLHLRCIGNQIKLDLPIKLHKHFISLRDREGSILQNSFLITRKGVQFSFKIDTGTKKTEGQVVGIDTGINALATLNTGEQYGRDIKPLIERIKRGKYGSNRQRKLRRALRHRMCEVAKQIIPDKQLVVIEDLKNLNHKTKFTRRVNKNMRRSLGAWTYSTWLERVELACQDNRVSLRRVNPAYTSQCCPACSHTERGNRVGEVFACQSCGYTDNADVVGATNILSRFLCSPYGAAYQDCQPFVNGIVP